MTFTQIICGHCGNTSNKSSKEIERQIRKGRTVFYCNVKCSGLGVNSSEKAREIGKQAALTNFIHLIHDPDHASKAKLGKERWKYRDLFIYLRIRGVSFRFEYPLLLESGNVRLYDLSLLDYKILVEFDGKYHDRSLYSYRDQEKDLLAERSGWKLIRVKVKENSIIPAAALRGIL